MKPIFILILLCFLASNNSFSVYKPGMEAIRSLEGTNYARYIQRVYINPKEENKLMILIKPNYWAVLTKKDKEKIISKISVKWRDIYIKLNPESDFEPETCFANI